MSEKDQLNMIRCPKCGALILHDDLRVTGTFAGSAEVKAHCTLCDEDVLFGYVDLWHHCTSRQEKAAAQREETKNDIDRIMGEETP